MSRFTLLLGLATALGSGGLAFAAAPIPEAVTKVRDPFKKPIAKIQQEKPRSELELYPVEKFKLAAVITGPKRLRAMLVGPDGKSYFVAEGMAIGFRKGVIRKITHDTVLVREQVLNVLGQEENVDSELKLPEEGKSLGPDSGISGQPPSQGGGGDHKGGSG